MSYNLSLEQTQKLIMTPELRQAIKILQLSSMELTDYIGEEILNNPILEYEEEDNLKEPTVDKEKAIDSTKSKNEEIDWEEYFSDSSDLGYIRGYREKDKEEYSYENFVSKAPSLNEFLTFQLSITSTTDKNKKIGEYIIGCLDKNGYLTCHLSDIARMLNVSPEEVEEALSIIQTFDPVGVGARSLEECLLIQVSDKGFNSPYIEIIIRNHLNHLADGKLSKIAHTLDISAKEVQDIKDIIKTLDPKPARNFTENDIQYVIPDAVVEKVDNEYIVIVNDTTAPRLEINNYYKNLLAKENKESTTSKFLSNRLESALWLIKSIEQRRMTLYKVVSSIVEVQKDFFDKGIQFLKPLALKDIAEMVGVHESTVSRATNGKYVQTPRGIYELKFFFNSSISNIIGDSKSSGSIKQMIKEAVDDEDPSKPLSDQKVADMFKKEGIIISRRTVAKYRDELNIPSSSKRKRY